MSTVFSTLKSNLDSNITTNQQYNSDRNQNLYSSFFNECGSLNTTSATSSYVDFDISDTIVKSVNIAKENRYVYHSKPITKKKFKNPCGICHKSVNDNQKAILCNTCDLWIHRKCNGTTVKEYEMYCKEDDNIPWMCIFCSIDELASKFSFGYLSKLELNDLFGIDLPSQLELLPSYELRPKPSQIPNLNDFDIEENYVQTINLKYYDLHDFNNLTASIGKCL